MSDEKQAKRFYASGRVQGVGYRYFTHRAAETLGVAGYVKNLPDGRVEIYAVGTETQLLELAGHLRKGPPHGRVELIDELNTEMLPEFRGGFFVEYGD